MKKVITVLLAAFFITIPLGLMWRGNVLLKQLVVEAQELTEATTCETPEPIIEQVEVPVAYVVHDTVYIHKDGEDYEVPYTKEELDAVVCIVHCEAGNQDAIGKRLVADTIFNRVHCQYFPDTITDVIYQHVGKQYQYGVVNSKRFKQGTSICTEDEFQIVYEEALSQLDTEVIYFRTKIFPSCGKHLYQHGAHFFSGLKEGLDYGY